MATATSYKLSDVRDATIASIVSYIPGLTPTHGLTGQALDDAVTFNRNLFIQHFRSEEVDNDQLNEAAIDRFFARYEIVGSSDTGGSDASVAARDAGIGVLLVFDKQQSRYVFIVDGTEFTPAKATGNETRQDALANIYIAFNAGTIENDALKAAIRKVILESVDGDDALYNEVLSLIEQPDGSYDLQAALVAFNRQVTALTDYIFEQSAILGIPASELAVIGDSLGGAVLVEVILRESELQTVDGTLLNTPGRNSYGSAGGVKLTGDRGTLSPEAVQTLIGYGYSIPENLRYFQTDGDPVGGLGITLGQRSVVAELGGFPSLLGHSKLWILSQLDGQQRKAVDLLTSLGVPADEQTVVYGIYNNNYGNISSTDNGTAIFVVPVTINGIDYLVALGENSTFVDVFGFQVRNPNLLQETDSGQTILLLGEDEIIALAADPTLQNEPEYQNAANSADKVTVNPDTFCFGAGTQILLADATTKAIEEVEVGDEVLAFNPNVDKGRGDLLAKKVTETFLTKDSEVIKLNDITVSLGHLFLSESGEFASADSFSAGDNLVGQGGDLVRIEKIESAQKRETVYNFTVEGLHTYIAGGIRVHNKSAFVGTHFGDDKIVQAFEGDKGILLLVGENIYGTRVLIRAFPVTDSNGATTYFAQRYLSGKNVQIILEGEMIVVPGDGGQLEKAVFKNPDEVTRKVEFADKTFVGEQIGQVFGSTLGRHIAGENVFAQIGVSAALSTVLGNLGEVFNKYFVLGNFQESQDLGFSRSEDFSVSVDDSLSDIGEDFFNQIKSASIGAISSYITAELIDALGLEGFGGELAATVGNTVINQTLSNLIDIAGGAEVGVFDGINGNLLGNAVSSFLGSKLANKIISADTVAGQLGGSIGGSIGSIIASNIFGSIAGGKIGSVLGNFILPGIGALIGTLLGTLIGDLFGTIARSGADLDYDPGTGTFRVGASYKKGKASKATAEALAGQVGEALNGILGLVGGVITNPEDIDAGHYGLYKGAFRYQAAKDDSRKRARQISFAEAGDLVAFGTLVALEDVKIAGGDIFLKRALNQSLTNQKQGGKTLVGGIVTTAFRPADFDGNTLNDPEIEILLGDLSVARDYAGYLENAPIINALIAASPDSAFAAGWIITLQRSYELGLHRRAASDWYGGWDYVLEEKDARIASLGVSIDSISGERLISFLDNNGQSVVLGDTIDTAGRDLIEGTSGSDSIVINGATVAAGTSVNGVITTAATQLDVGAIIRGGDGNDTIYGGDRGNDIYGEGGDDYLYGGKTADWIFGGAGNDVLDAYVSDDGNYLDGGAGNDTLIGRAGSDWLQGGAGVDTLDAGDGNDILEGGASDGDILRGGRGDDVYLFRAGDGSDRISDEGFAQAAPERPSFQVSVDLRFGPQLFDRFDAIEFGYLDRNWQPQAPGIQASSETNAGAVANARGVARGGEDTIAFGTGIGLENIRIRKDVDGAGIADDLIIEVLDDNGVLTGDVVRLEDWFDPFSRIEWLKFADGQSIRIGDFTSFIVGTEGDDTIIASDGQDFVHGGAGNDVIQLLGGNDIGNGGLGDDFITGDAGNDIVIGGNDDDLVLGGTGRDVVSGNQGNDVVRGGEGNDILSGGKGDDTVVGGAGNDIIRYNRGDGFDTIFDAYSASEWVRVFDGPLGWVSGVTFPDVDHDNDVTTAPVTQTVYNGTVLFDGVNWNGAYRFDTVTNRLDWHSTGDVADLGTNDIIEFAIGIDIDDLVFLEDGDDLIVGIGGPISDNVSFDALADKIRLKGWLSAGKGIEKFAFFNTGILDVEQFSQMKGGTDGADTINGSISNDWITGGAGADVINGGDGDDLLVGQGGDDYILGGDGDDTLLGGSGSDVLEGGYGADVLVGGGGFDIASYSGASSGVYVKLNNQATVGGSPTSDVFVSIEGLEGSSYNDTLIGDDADNELRGGGGDDRLEGRAGDDEYTVQLGHGNDTISDRGVDLSGYSYETVRNQFGAVLAPFEESFTLISSEPSGSTTIYEYFWTIRHSGTNELVYSETKIYFTEQNQNIAPTFFNNSSWRNGFQSTGNGYEVRRQSGSAAYFDGGNDSLFWDTGESLSNLSFAYDGADMIISGGEGSVRIENFANANFVIEELAFSDGLVANLENIYLNSNGSTGNDFVVGDNTANILDGGAGADVVSGAGGDDTLSGGDGDDILEGGAGGDAIDGGTGRDEVRYLGSNTGVSVDLALGTASGGEAAGDTLTNIEDVRGSNFADTLNGDAGDNRLFGYDGADILSGAGGADFIRGGAGADQISGGAGDDDLHGNSGADTIYGDDGVDRILGGSGDDVLYGGAGNDHLAGMDGEDVLDGGADNDVLIGGDGADTLRGDGGDDLLIGGADNDQLEGGAGNDNYQFDLSSGQDVVVDSDGANTISLIGVLHENIRFDRTGDDLVIRTLTAPTSITLQGYFVGATTMHTISAGNYVLYFGHAQEFFDLFASLPEAATALTPTIVSNFDRYWHLEGNARPEAADQLVETQEDIVFSGALVVDDHDDNITGYELAGSPGNGIATVDAVTGDYTYTPDQDYYGEDSFYINILDSEGNLSDVLVTVSVTPVNDAPASVSFVGSSDIDENASDLTLGNIAAIDVDGVLNEHVFSVDDARFEIVDDTIRLRSGITIDFEAEPTVSVTLIATDGAGLSNVGSTIEFTINDVNEGISVVGQSYQVDENVSVGTVVGVVSATDPDTGQFGELRYYFSAADGSAISASQDGLFSINETSGEITVIGVLDYEAVYAPSHSVLVRDNAGNSGYNEETVTVDIVVTDVNEAPYSVTLDNLSLDENLDGGIIGVVGATDPDSLDTPGFSSLTFTVDDTRFEIDGLGQFRLKAGQALDFEVEPSLDVMVTATDMFGAGLSSTQSFSITVNDQVDVLYGTSASNVINGAQGIDQIYGLGGDDEIYGAAGDDLLDGGVGGDTIYGGEGNDVILGRQGSDILYGGAGDDVLRGGIEDASENTLFGGVGDDELHGGLGNDTLVGGSGADAFFGEGGIFDIVSYEDATSGVTVDLANGANNTGDALGDTYADIHGFRGSEFADILIGDSGDNQFIGALGDDTLDGGDGDDILDGGDGDDLLIGGAGNDTLFGGDGNDILDAGDGNDVLDGGAGSDILIGGLDQDRYIITRASGADTIRNYDPSGAGDTISFADDIKYDDLWFSRSNDDLVITVIGTGSEAVIENWYLSPMAGEPDNTFKLELFLAGDREAIGVSAENLVTMMASYAVPANDAERDVALSVIGGQVDALWGFSTPPAIDDIGDLVIAEDGTVSFTIRVYDDKVAHENLEIGFISGNASLIDASNISVSAPDVDGYRTVTIMPSVNQSGTATITLQATDGGSSPAEKTFTLTVNAVADAPSLFVSEAVGNEGEAIALDIQATLVDNDGSETLLIEITAVPVGVTLNNGSYDVGTDTWTLTPADFVGLTATVPVDGSGNDFALTVTAIATDDADTKTTTQTLNVSVNGAPGNLAAVAPLTVDENAVNGFVVGQVTHIDPDGDSISYSLVDDVNGRFSIASATGIISVLDGSLIDHEANEIYTLRVRVEETGANPLSAEMDFDVAVVDVNEAPGSISFSGGADVTEILGNSYSFDENVLATDASVVFLNANDPDIAAPDASWSQLSYYFVDSNGVLVTQSEDGLFKIDLDSISGAPRIAVVDATLLDYENPAFSNQTFAYNIAVIDGVGARDTSEDRQVSIELKNVNEAPTDIYIQEAPINILNGDFENSNTILDVPSSLGSYTIGAYGWTTEGSGTWAPNVASVYNQSLPSAGSRVLFVSDSASRLSSEIVIAGTDYVLSAQIGNRTSNTSFGGFLQLYAGDPSIIIASIAISDPGSGLWSEQSLSVSQELLGSYIGQAIGVKIVSTAGQLNIDDVALVALQDGVETTGTPFVNEDEQSLEYEIADFGSLDPEGGTMSYTLENSAGGRFKINATTGVLTIADASAIDYEAAKSHVITVKVTDLDLASRSEDFIVSVGNANEKPTITDITPSAHTSEPSADVINMPESKAKLNWDVAYLSSADPEGQASSYYFKHANGTYSTISEDTRFKIISNRIEVNQSVLSYESTPNSLSYTLAAKDIEGLYSSPKAITIKITDINETPSVNNATWSRAENWNPQNKIGTLTFNDPDLSTSSFGQLKFTITGGNTGTKFRVDNAGRIWLNSSLNYENSSQRNFSLTVKAQDKNGSGLSDTATVNINVTNVNEAPVVTSITQYFIENNTYGTFNFFQDINAYDPDGASISYTIIGGTGAWQQAIVSGSGFVQFPYVRMNRVASVKVRISDGSINVDRTVFISQEIAFPVGGGGGPGGPYYPIVFDLDGDGVELLGLIEDGGVQFDVDSDGVLEYIGWAAPDDAILAIDRNGDGIINNGSEISYIDDLEGATSDLEGLVAFDSNLNGIIDAGDTRWAEFLVWQDSNSDGISQANELQTLDAAGVAAISLTRTLTGAVAPSIPHYDNVISATSEYVLTDGTVLESADVAFAYYEVEAGGFGVPIILDLDGDGLELISAHNSPVWFDVSGDGILDRTGWVNSDDGLLALDRNGDGVINDISEISFKNDLAGAHTDLEGLKAYDSNDDGAFDAADDRFDDFLVWRDSNQNGISESGELLSLTEAGVVAIYLDLTPTGEVVEGAFDNVVTNTAQLLNDRGRYTIAGDVAFRYDRGDGSTTNETIEDHGIGDTNTAESHTNHHDTGGSPEHKSEGGIVHSPEGDEEVTVGHSSGQPRSTHDKEIRRAFIQKMLMHEDLTDQGADTGRRTMMEHGGHGGDNYHVPHHTSQAAHTDHGVLLRGAFSSDTSAGNVQDLFDQFLGTMTKNHGEFVFEDRSKEHPGLSYNHSKAHVPDIDGVVNLNRLISAMSSFSPAGEGDAQLLKNRHAGLLEVSDLAMPGV